MEYKIETKDNTCIVRSLDEFNESIAVNDPVAFIRVLDVYRKENESISELLNTNGIKDILIEKGIIPKPVFNLEKEFEKMKTDQDKLILATIEKIKELEDSLRNMKSMLEFFYKK